MRFAGTDGVSLETTKWAQVLQQDGHEVFFMAGELDTDPDRSFLVPEAHFTHPTIVNIHKDCFGHSRRTPEATLLVESLKHKLKASLREFISMYKLDLLIPQNAVTIPLNLPLGLALTEIAVEQDFPMLSHNHDFYWERKRFLRNGCWDYLNKAFPPNLPMIQHAVLNSSQRHQLGLRTGISATMIPNVMDFTNPPPPPDGATDAVRNALGLAPEEKLILQPTRIVKRKGIEHSIELIHRLDVPAALVISHASGDEGDDYAQRVLEYSDVLNVRTILAEKFVDAERGTDADGNPQFTLTDLYQSADLVTYPSVLEGFGNALLEAIYHKCPLMVNCYSVYQLDIKPRGIEAIEIDDYVSQETVDAARRVLQNPTLAHEVSDRNYELGTQFFSYEVLRSKLQVLLMNLFGS